MNNTQSLRTGRRNTGASCHGERENGRIVLGSQTLLRNLYDPVDCPTGICGKASFDNVGVLLSKLTLAHVIRTGFGTKD
jgi:hypothetical protein